MSEIQTRPHEMPIYDPNVQTEAVNEIVTVIDHPNWTEPMQATWFDQSPDADIILGSELIPATGWTSADWTGNSVDGWEHTTGNTTALLNSLAGVVDKLYLISLTVSGRTAGSFTVTFGGEVSGAIAATYSYSIKATTTGTLIVTPTTDFDGTIIISVKQIVWELTEAEILTILGVDDVVQSSDLTGYVEAEAGKSLIDDTEIARLLTIGNSYTINLPAAANLAAKIAAATEGVDYPTGWVLTATDTINLTITHGLAKEIDHVTVKKVVGAAKTILKPYSTAYSEVTATTTSILVIEGIDPTTTQTLIHLTFLA